MSLDAILDRAPYHVRPGARPTVADRHDESAFVVIEPLNSAADRRAFADAWVAHINALAAQRDSERSALPQAAE